MPRSTESTAGRAGRLRFDIFLSQQRAPLASDVAIGADKPLINREGIYAPGNVLGQINNPITKAITQNPDDIDL